MARKSSTHEGFVMIALDLFAAIASSDMPNRCQVVLAEALLELYGPHKAECVQLVPASIEHFTGLHRNNARRAIGELVSWGILTANPDGSFAFNKDYESWRVKGVPLSDRLGGGLQKFAASALTRHGKRATHKRETQSREIQVSASTSIHRDSGKCQYLNPDGLTLDPPPLKPPIEETHARLDLRIKNKERCASHAREDFSETAEPATPDDTDAQLEQDHANRARFVQAVRDSFGSLLQLEQWLVRYSHEYDDTDRAIRAVNEVKADIRAGIKINSIGGAIRAKYNALANGNTFSRNGSTRKPHEMDKYGELLLQKQRERERERARRNAGVSVAGDSDVPRGASSS